MKKEKNWTRWIYWFTFAVAVIAVYKTLDNLNDITMWFKRLLGVILPFLAGSLIAYILYIPSKSIEQTLINSKVSKRKARPLAIFITYLLAFLAIIFLVNIILPAISASLVDLAKNLPEYYSRTLEYIQNQPDDSILKSEAVLKALVDIQKVDITKLLNVENITDYIGKAMGIASGIFTAFVSVIISVYILLERTEILKFIRKINQAFFKRATCKELDKYFETTNQIFSKFISSQILDGIIIGIIMAIALSIMKVKYAVLLGFLIGLFNIIPYFGAIISIIIAAIITIFTGGFSKAIWMAIVATILQQIDANIINPKIVKDALKLSPILIIFSVTIGGAYFGFAGMFLAVPIVAVTKIFILSYLDTKIEAKNNNKDIKV